MTMAADRTALHSSFSGSMRRGAVNWVYSAGSAGPVSGYGNSPLMANPRHCIASTYTVNKVRNVKFSQIYFPQNCRNLSALWKEPDSQLFILMKVTPLKI